MARQSRAWRWSVRVSDNVLEDLLTKAMVKQTPHKARRLPGGQVTLKELAAAEKRIREQFYSPDNWFKTRTVALIHEDTETLLGNFTEHHSKLEKTARRLIRVTEPCTVDAVEYVKGENWLNPVPIGQPDKPEVAAEETRDAVCDLHMPEMDNVFAPAALVTVVLHWGSIARVELSDETRFFSKDRRVQLILPAGLDVREGLSLETKLRLKEFLGL